MASTDVILGWHETLPFVYVGFLGQVLCGVWATSASQSFSGRLPEVIGKGFLGSVAFYLISNLGVFLVTGLYPKTTTGFLECFILAIPFFKNQMAGDILYSSILFPIYFYSVRRFSPVSR